MSIIMTSCLQILDVNQTYITYSHSVREIFKVNDALLSRIYLFIDGLFSKIIPAVLFPIVTVILVVDIQKFTETRSRMFSEPNQSSVTTKLIIYMSISFIFSELPSGIFYLWEAYCGQDGNCRGPASSGLYLSELVSIITTFAHFPICFVMSHQYRDTVRALFRIKTSVTVEQQQMSVTN
uniref:G_PROTEIN_RECEP_F1_2 domain-containing protein n=1 Tax=Caenorhabditis tropicalis TaxID=1561998 RepID=A0A1I7U5A7_9PELO